MPANESNTVDNSAIALVVLEPRYVKRVKQEYVMKKRYRTLNEHRIGTLNMCDRQDRLATRELRCHNTLYPVRLESFEPKNLLFSKLCQFSTDFT